MASKLDLALDEVIKERRKENRGKRGNNNSNNNNNRSNGNRSDFGSRRNRDGGIRKRNNDNGGGSFAARSFVRSIDVPNQRRNVNGQWSHDKFNDDDFSSSSIQSRLGSRPLSGRIGGGNNNNMELSVENLHYDVTEKDLQELFSSVGEIQRARITFDLSGRSTGCAFVKYVDIEDAKKALEKFNGVLFDGQPMRIELKERERPERRENNRGGNRNYNNNNRRNGNGNGGRFSRGSGGGSSRNRNNHNGGGRDNKNLTAEELDREMETYMSNNNNDNNDNDMILD